MNNYEGPIRAPHRLHLKIPDEKHGRLTASLFNMIAMIQKKNHEFVEQFISADTFFSNA